MRCGQHAPSVKARPVALKYTVLDKIRRRLVGVTMREPSELDVQHDTLGALQLFNVLDLANVDDGGIWRHTSKLKRGTAVQHLRLWLRCVPPILRFLFLRDGPGQLAVALVSKLVRVQGLLSLQLSLHAL